MLTAQEGHVVTIDVDLQPENGFVPQPLFEWSGEISFVLGQSNQYLPGLHALVQGRNVGETVGRRIRNDNDAEEKKDDTNDAPVSIDAGYGRHRSDLVMTVSKARLLASLVDSATDTKLKPGSVVHLKGSLPATIVEVNDDTVTVDANHPLAGSSYACSFTVLDVQELPESVFSYQASKASFNRYQACTFALGCFWGAELNFMRLPGVIGTKVGYALSPSKGHRREAVQVLFDSTELTYRELLDVALEWLVDHKSSSDASRAAVAAASSSSLGLHELFYSPEDDDDEAAELYKYGVFCLTNQQRQVAEEVLSSSHHSSRHRWATQAHVEVGPMTSFDDAPEWNQQYLLKHGQSARKGAREAIRCYG